MLKNSKDVLFLSAEKVGHAGNFWTLPPSSVGIATRYGLDGPGIESQWEGEIFHTRPDRSWGPPCLLYNGYRVFPGGKAAGKWRWPPTPIQRRGWRKSRAITLLRLWAFVACSRANFTFTFTGTALWGRGEQPTNYSWKPFRKKKTLGRNKCRRLGWYFKYFDCFNVAQNRFQRRCFLKAANNR